MKGEIRRTGNGQSYTLSSNSQFDIANYVSVEWYVGDDSDFASASKSPITTDITGTNVTGNVEITIIYGKDNGGGGGTTPDGTEDFDVTRRWVVQSTGTALDASLPDETSYWNVGESFTQAHDYGVTIPVGWTYQGYMVTVPDDTTDNIFANKVLVDSGMNGTTG